MSVQSSGPPAQEPQVSRRTLIWRRISLIGSLVVLLGVCTHGYISFVDRSASISKLKSIASALHAYTDAKGQMPPVQIRDQRDQPVHSWRVLILPYLAHPAAQETYSRYDFGERWNGSINLAVLESGMYGKSLLRSRSQMSCYLALVDSDGSWNSVRDVRGSAADPVIVIEYPGSNVFWTQPRDLVLHDGAVYLEHRDSEQIKVPVAGLRALRQSGAFCQIPADLTEDELRAFLLGQR